MKARDRPRVEHISFSNKILCLGMKRQKGKNMRKKFKKIKWKRLLTAGLALLLLVGAIAGIAALAGKDTKKISSFAFTRGSLDESGNFVKGEISIVTEDLFECQGLTIKPDFKALGTYQVYYYTANKTFLGTTGVLNTSAGGYAKNASFLDAKYARIVITPDDEGDEDFKIRFFEIASYANYYTITVNKKQNFKAYNYYEIDADMVGYAYYVDEVQGTLSANATVGYYASKWFDVDDGATFRVGMKADFEGTQNLMFVYKLADGKYWTGLHKQLTCENTGEMVWIEIPVTHSTPVVSVSLMVQDCTGRCPDLVIERW